MGLAASDSVGGLLLVATDRIELRDAESQSCIIVAFHSKPYDALLALFIPPVNMVISDRLVVNQSLSL